MAMQKIKRARTMSGLSILPQVQTLKPPPQCPYLGAKIGIRRQPKQNVYFHHAKHPQ